MITLKNDRRGFTLLEFLLTTAIISLMMAVAFPKFINTIKNAKLARMTADFKAIETATLLYNTDTGEWPRVRGLSYTNMEGYLYAYGTNVTGWNGPYLKKWPNSPFWKGAVEHIYNYQFDYKMLYGNKSVCIEVSFANYKDYLAKIQDLDNYIDKGDGATRGRLVWTSGSWLAYWIMVKNPSVPVKNANGTNIL